MSGRHRTVARVTLEFTSPFLIGTGVSDAAGADALPVVDHRGLPLIPGTSLAGVVRHAFATREGEAESGFWFGHIGSSGAEIAGSRVRFTAGHVHDAEDRPVDGGIMDPPRHDEVLASAQVGTRRQRVRLNAYGAVDGSGKFDESAVPAGHRFTFDLTVQDDDPEDSVLPRLLACLADHHVRLGGGGRSGRGAFEIRRAAARTFDLGRPEDLEAYAELPVRLDRAARGLEPISIPTEVAVRDEDLSLDLPLRIESGLLVGNDGYWPEEQPENQDVNLALPACESRVAWQGDRGSLEDLLVVPASGIKGALRHRFAFHANALAARFADTLDGEALERCLVLDIEEVDELFGAMKEGEASHAGRVFLEDLWLSEPNSHEHPLQTHTHNSIDRFTGGVRAQVLWSERVIADGELPPLRIHVSGWKRLSENARKAFAWALEDLANGDLAIGSRSARGLGHLGLKDGQEFAALWKNAAGEEVGT